MEKETVVKFPRENICPCFFGETCLILFVIERPHGEVSKTTNEVKDMTTIELQALTVVRTYLPRIAEELKRIVDALENQNNKKEA